MTYRIIQGDSRAVLPTLPESSVHCCVTSPPYWGLRDYGTAQQIGLEATPDQYVSEMVAVFREVRRVLRDDGTLWLNLGDSYAHERSSGQNDFTTSTLSGGKGKRDPLNADGHRKSLPADVKKKDLVGIPWMVAFALRKDGWYLRSDIIWHKPNPMPESVTDRPTKAHEYLFLLSKSDRYYYDSDAIAERGSNGMRNKRSVWTVSPAQFGDAHFATFPSRLVLPCILAGCPVAGTVLDPFNGAGTTGLVAQQRGRDYIGIELNPEFVDMSRSRIRNDAPMFNVEIDEPSKPFDDARQIKLIE